ncbi:MAG: pilus assembly protein [Sphingomonadaceae bacterium]|jgi:Flp pilus assembly protein TadG|nr:pilus assembly protein [Sphingomonadaceae bacterium]
MIRPRNLARCLRRNKRGTVAIETAFVAPVLVLMSLGAFQISTIVARQSELQSAMDEAQAIALATDPDTPEERLTLQQVIMASTDLPATNVSVTEAYRCDGANVYVTANTCAQGTRVASYVKIQITDSYTPVWAEYGVGNALNFDQSRYVMYKQATKA